MVYEIIATENFKIVLQNIGKISAIITGFTIRLISRSKEPVRSILWTTRDYQFRLTNSLIESEHTSKWNTKKKPTTANCRNTEDIHSSLVFTLNRGRNKLLTQSK